MKPMLAAATSGTSLNYPLLASPKLDGVRCLIINGVATSRSLKAIPNAHVQKLFGRKQLDGLDGELIVGPPHGKDAYRNTMSGVMSEDGEPSVTFHVFDHYKVRAGFEERLLAAYKVVADHGEKLPLKMVRHATLKTAKALELYERVALAQGYEGVMLRDPEGPYKEGRSTEREGWLMKLKRFVDGEAVILGCVPLYENHNEAKRNALGQLERSSHKEGRKAVAKLGSLDVQDVKTGQVFGIGTGFTDADRLRLWRERNAIEGKIVKYKSQPVGVKDAPRFPVFLGFRDARDM